jgi:hypothetical protein
MISWNNIASPDIQANHIYSYIDKMAVDTAAST